MLPVPSNLEIRDEVNTFLASLPLGTTRRDAQVEDAVARQLYALLNTRADLQLKLNQWWGPHPLPVHAHKNHMAM
jgi:hypothetical protein